MNLIRLLGIISTLAIFITATGCGKLTDAQRQDLATLLGGVSSLQASGTNGSYLDAPLERSGNSLAETLRQRADTAIWFAQFGITPMSSADALTPFTSSCPTLPSTIGTATCTTSCPTSSKLKFSCTNTAEKATCGGTTFIFTGLTISTAADVSAVAGSGATIRGTLGMELYLSAEVTGGNLDGGTLACSLSLSFDVAKVRAGTAQTPTLDCSNFSCSYNGQDIDCESLKSSLGSVNACS